MNKNKFIEEKRDFFSSITEFYNKLIEMFNRTSISITPEYYFYTQQMNLEHTISYEEELAFFLLNNFDYQYIISSEQIINDFYLEVDELINTNITKQFFNRLIFVICVVFSCLILVMTIIIDHYKLKKCIYQGFLYFDNETIDLKVHKYVKILKDINNFSSTINTEFFDKEIQKGKVDEPLKVNNVIDFQNIDNILNNNPEYIANNNINKLTMSNEMKTIGINSENRVVKVNNSAPATEAINSKNNGNLNNNIVDNNDNKKDVSINYNNINVGNNDNTISNFIPNETNEQTEQTLLKNEKINKDEKESNEKADMSTSLTNKKVKINKYQSIRIFIFATIFLITFHYNFIYNTCYLNKQIIKTNEISKYLIHNIHKIISTDSILFQVLKTSIIKNETIYYNNTNDSIFLDFYKTSKEVESNFFYFRGENKSYLDENLIYIIDHELNLFDFCKEVYNLLKNLTSISGISYSECNTLPISQGMRLYSIKMREFLLKIYIEFNENVEKRKDLNYLLNLLSNKELQLYFESYSTIGIAALTNLIDIIFDFIVQFNTGDTYVIFSMCSIFIVHIIIFILYLNYVMFFSLFIYFEKYRILISIIDKKILKKEKELKNEYNNFF